MTKLSVVVPCFNEQEALPLFYENVREVIRQIADLEVEWWFIDDGSTDGTLDEIRDLHKTAPKQVHYVSFSRNFGKESALYAGLQLASGDYVVIMDADLQDPPSLLPKMYEILQKGDYDCVGTRRTNRNGEGRLKSLLSNQFYRMINHLSHTNIRTGVRDFRMMTKQVANAVLAMPEYSRFSKGIFSWIGFRTKYLEYPNVQRVAGTTNWSLWKLFKYAFDGIADFSQVPLSLAVWLGMGSFVLSILGLLFVIMRRILAPSTSVFGWASIICVILLLGGLQLLCIGIVGEYIGRIYMQVKGRPMYIIKEKK